MRRLVPVPGPVSVWATGYRSWHGSNLEGGQVVGWAWCLRERRGRCSWVLVGRWFGHLKSRQGVPLAQGHGVPLIFGPLREAPDPPEANLQ